MKVLTALCFLLLSRKQLLTVFFSDSPSDRKSDCSSAGDGTVTCSRVTSLQGLSASVVVFSANAVLWHGA